MDTELEIFDADNFMLPSHVHKRRRPPFLDADWYGVGEEPKPEMSLPDACAMLCDLYEIKDDINQKKVYETVRKRARELFGSAKQKPRILSGDQVNTLMRHMHPYLMKKLGRQGNIDDFYQRKKKDQDAQVEALRYVYGEVKRVIRSGGSQADINAVVAPDAYPSSIFDTACPYDDLEKGRFWEWRVIHPSPASDVDDSRDPEEWLDVPNGLPIYATRDEVVWGVIIWISQALGFDISEVAEDVYYRTSYRNGSFDTRHGDPTLLISSNYYDELLEGLATKFQLAQEKRIKALVEKHTRALIKELNRDNKQK